MPPLLVFSAGLPESVPCTTINKVSNRQSSLHGVGAKKQETQRRAVRACEQHDGAEESTAGEEQYAKTLIACNSCDEI